MRATTFIADTNKHKDTVKITRLNIHHKTLILQESTVRALQF